MLSNIEFKKTNKTTNLEKKRNWRDFIEMSAKIPMAKTEKQNSYKLYALIPFMRNFFFCEKIKK